MIVRFIGDVHGDRAQYLRIIEDCETSIHVGDYGIPPHPVLIGPGHRWIRGNHDNPADAKAHPAWIPDGTVEDGILYLGGAYSHDKDFRTPGVDWWDDEELSQGELDAIVAKVADVKINLIVSHTGPTKAIRKMRPPSIRRGDGLVMSRTMLTLQKLVEQNRPKLVIFGHWHITKQVKLGDTICACLGIGTYVDLDLDILR